MDDFFEIIPIEHWEMPIRYPQLKELLKYNENIDLLETQGKFISIISIKTQNGDMIAEDDDWIIRDIKNNIYPIKTILIQKQLKNFK